MYSVQWSQYSITPRDKVGAGVPRRGGVPGHSAKYGAVHSNQEVFARRFWYKGKSVHLASGTQCSQPYLAFRVIVIEICKGWDTTPKKLLCEKYFQDKQAKSFGMTSRP